jgi:hypothetical protein
MYKNEHFTKTGSGQTQGSKKGPFFLRNVTLNPDDLIQVRKSISIFCAIL